MVSRITQAWRILILEISIFCHTYSLLCWENPWPWNSTHSEGITGMASLDWFIYPHLSESQAGVAGYIAMVSKTLFSWSQQLQKSFHSHNGVTAVLQQHVFLLHHGKCTVTVTTLLWQCGVLGKLCSDTNAIGCGGVMAEFLSKVYNVGTGL